MAAETRIAAGVFCLPVLVHSLSGPAGRIWVGVVARTWPLQDGAGSSVCAHSNIDRLVHASVVACSRQAGSLCVPDCGIDRHACTHAVIHEQ